MNRKAVLLNLKGNREHNLEWELLVDVLIRLTRRVKSMSIL